MGGTDPHRLLHIGGGFRENHRIGGHALVPRDILAMLVAHRLHGRELVAQMLAQLGNRGVNVTSAGDRGGKGHLRLHRS